MWVKEYNHMGRLEIINMVGKIYMGNTILGLGID